MLGAHFEADRLDHAADAVRLVSHGDDDRHPRAGSLQGAQWLIVCGRRDAQSQPRAAATSGFARVIS